MTSDIIKQWEKMNESEQVGSVKKGYEIPSSSRVAAMNKQQPIERQEENAPKKKEIKNEYKIPSKLGVKFSNKAILKSSKRATVYIPSSRFSSILKERNIYFK